MKLDATKLRYLEKNDFRVLTAIEMGMRNHDLVPTTLIDKIAKLRFGGTKRSISTLLKFKLVHHESKRYDGYRLTYAGYDYLALKVFTTRGKIYAIGRQIGVGKESDIFSVMNDDNTEICLKIHRLGRVSFKSIRNNRDYVNHRRHGNWLYFSRLAALKEYAFMKALHNEGFSVPEPIDCNRHCILMSLVPGYPLCQYREIAEADLVFRQCMTIVIRLAEYGLIHGDFNEFNLMLTPEAQIVLIDFPQMVSTEHKNAAEYFERDVACIHTFFRKFGVESDWYPSLDEIHKERDLDTQVEASGFTHRHRHDWNEMDDYRRENDNQEEEEEENDENDENDNNNNNNYINDENEEENENNNENQDNNNNNNNNDNNDINNDNDNDNDNVSTGSSNFDEDENQNSEEEEHQDNFNSKEQKTETDIVKVARKNASRKHNRGRKVHKKNQTKGKNKSKMKNQMKFF